MNLKAVLLVFAAIIPSEFDIAEGQNTGLAVNAKIQDSVSPTGVSYTSGSFVYSLPLLTIGSGEFPDSIPVILNYDSAYHFADKTGWSLSNQLDASAMVLSAVYDRYDQYDEPSNEPLYDQWEYGVYFTVGKSSRAFEIRNPNLPLEDFHHATNSGYRLDYNAASETFAMTTPDGGVMEVVGRINEAPSANVYFEQLKKYTAANGSVYKHTNDIYENKTIKFSRSENYRGYVVVTEPAVENPNGFVQKICSYNRAYFDESQTQNCANSTHFALLNYSKVFGSGSTQSYWVKLDQVTRPDGSSVQFEYTKITAISGYNLMTTENQAYTGARVRFRLVCVRNNGGPCLFNNQYDACDGYSGQGYANPGGADPGWTGSRDRVVSQSFPDGMSVSYSYPGQTVPCRDVTSVHEAKPNGTKKITLRPHDNWLLNVGYLSHNYRSVDSVTDELNQETEYGWTGANPSATYLKRDDLVSEIKYPEDNIEKYTYDMRGNILEVRSLPKPNAQIAQIVKTATYPTNCTNPKICNKPTAIADGRGNATEFTYDPTHGGVLTETAPADVNGIRRQTRYEYTQRYARFKAGNGYTPAATPVWLLFREEYCKTTAAVGANCAGGANDEVITEYDYGPDSGPNNLLLRGIVVTATGSTGAIESLRTCYGYDAMGRRISETQPAANLATCP
jgi:hypothetical protein